MDHENHQPESSMPARHRTPAQRLAVASRLRLSHAQARFVLWHMDCASGDDEETFDAALKNLRKAGVPFGSGGGRGVDAAYGFGDLAELALAFVLRQQGLTARHAVPLLRDNRAVLRALMLQALKEATTGMGAPVTVRVSPSPEGDEEGRGPGAPGRAAPLAPPAPRSFPVDGAWLDFGLLVNRGVAPMSPAPRLLSPAEALVTFTARLESLQRRLPVPASDIAVRLVDLAEAAPRVKRGRPKAQRSGDRL